MGFITPRVKFWEPDYNFQWIGGGTAAADPQLQFFENFPGHLGAGFAARSDGTLSIHAVNIPLSLSFRFPVVLLSRPNSGGQQTVQFGLYSLNGATLSLANSASNSVSFSSATSWISMVTSATQNISPGAWYFAINALSSQTSNLSFLANSSFAPVNAIPGGFLMGRMTVSTNAIPASIATSDLDITGSDAIRQPYIIITA